MTYNEAETKIFDAYFKDEIRPCSAMFCFCGTLAGGDEWYWKVNETNFTLNGYTGEEYVDMEWALFKGMDEVDIFASEPSDDNYEEALFNGMCKALEELKNIHLAKGETIDGNIGLKKRNLISKQLVNDQ